MSRGKDWVAVTPDGRFDGTPRAWRQIAWRFSEKLFDIAPAEAFFGDFFLPGLLGDVLQDRLAVAPATVGQKDRRMPLGALTAAVPPVDSRSVRLRIVVREAAPDAQHKTGSGARDLRLFCNGALVKSWPGEIRGPVEIDAPLVSGPNAFSAYAFNHDNVKSEDAAFTSSGPAAPAAKPKLHVLAVGIDKYANPDFELRFAVADALSVANGLADSVNRLGRYSVEPMMLLDPDATRERIRRALAGLSRTVEPEDAVIVFFAGHGVAIGDRFYLLPRDLGYTGKRTDIDGAALAQLAANGISDQDLEKLLATIDARHIALIFDACNSGQALETAEKRRGPLNSTGLAQLAYEKGMYILTASQSFEAALETGSCGHGLLTWALVEDGLKTAAPDRAPKDGMVSLIEWLEFAVDRVPQLQLNSDATRGAALVNRARAPGRQQPRLYYRVAEGSEPLVIASPK
jgi:hypothetical protein